MSPNSRFEAVIGLEIHAQLKTESKIFSSDATHFDAGDNENTSPISMGMPGSLPVINRKVVEYSIMTGLALGCDIRKRSIFARKNYFYPDLPKGYQISQYDEPICENGFLEFKLNGETKKISITRAHMEEDAGKSNHYGEYTLLNYNRAGIPLLEIVSGPDMTSPAEAAEYARTMRQILRYLDVCDGNLEEGSLRCDCNVSVRLKGEKMLGTKVEIKNINSFRFVEKALEYEIDRQVDVIEGGGQIIQETRLWDPDKNKTTSMRTKENAMDYRYFPDPDLLPIVLTDEQILKFRNSIPELPSQRVSRFIETFQLSEYDALALTNEREIADYFEVAAAKSGNPKACANWVMTELLRELNTHHLSITQSHINAQQLAELISLVDKGTISGKMAKSVFTEMWTTKKSASEIVKSKGMTQITDVTLIEQIVDKVMAENPSQVAEFRSGKEKVLGFFVGSCMKASRGQASPDVLNQVLLKKLKG